MHRRFVISGALGALMLVAARAESQGIMGKIKDRARSEVDRKENEAIEALAKAVTCAITDKACIKKAHDAGDPVKVTDKNGKPVSSADSAAAISAAVAQAASMSDDPAASTPAAGAPPVAAASGAATAVGAGAWLNYDFVPGSRTLFYDDFSGDAVGDFPASMKLSDGNLEVANVKGQKLLRVAEAGVIFIVLPAKLPDRFTVEAVYHSPTTAKPMAIYTGGNKNRFGCFPSSAFVDAEAKSGMKATAKAPAGFVSCRFTVDTRYVRGYIDSARTSNAPGVTIARTDTLYFSIPAGTDNDPTLLASIRVADAGAKLIDVLSAKGRASTYGIVFDDGTDHIRGESTPTIAEIADMMKTHGPLSLTIEDHSDNAGTPAVSKSLSEKRAIAVKQLLVSKYGIASTRMKTAGLGGTKPIAPNTTAEGRQNNRRVDLVKL
ncbi:MAG: OmpA family protein [Gemmatimonadota bacterium]|nr:OmpA family protein [Gemmatimonadota bacterium]